MTSITLCSSILQANLDALGERNRDLAHALGNVADHTELKFGEAADGTLTATLAGKPLTSRHGPLEEAHRLVDEVDLVEHAVVVVMGFGLGYHVQALARRMQRTGLIVVFEPDLSLLRSVLQRIDHAAWMREAMIVFVTDPEDRGALAQKLHGGESILAQGIELLEHPASRPRLKEHLKPFQEMLFDHVAAAKTTLMTTLVRSVDTVRNLMLNLDHYAAGPSVAELKGAAAGRLGVVVAAGPSLRRNVHLLAREGVRDRCVIIAVQTTLKPLLAAGIKPHFVTALDYHEISQRFYEGLSARDVEGITLIADPKAHPSILDSFPGPVRCCAIDFLDRLLGDLKRDMGALPPGATVAHLALYIARFLGCNPIALIGQDLGFTDGLYYAPGTAIEDVWAPELNPFNTITMMEWQRIVRHRLSLRRTEDVHGRTIYTDGQMLAYLHQFERDFAGCAQDGIDVIDATEGGLPKQHVRTKPLSEVLAEHAASPLPPLPRSDGRHDKARLQATAARLKEVREDVSALHEIAGRTAPLLQKMLEHQQDGPRMGEMFRELEGYKSEVEKRFPTFELLNHLNQLGVFKRLKSDRRLHLQQDLDAMGRQRAQLDRDLLNVQWIRDAAAEMLRQLDAAQALLSGRAASAPGDQSPESEPHCVTVSSGTTAGEAELPGGRIAALVPVDPNRNGLGLERSLTEPFHGRSVVQATLERLGRCSTIESIILIVPDRFDIEKVIERSRIGRPVLIERGDGSPVGPEQRAIATARLWAPSCWRGGIAGMSVYDEVLCPHAMLPIMRRHELSAALIAAPDWPLIDPSAVSGCDAVVNRYREHPDLHNLVFTQAPPGLCGCLVTTTLMEELTQRTRLSTIGGLLVYQPHAPQGDPIARDANVQIEHLLRQSLIRATFDSPRQRRLLRNALDARRVDDMNSLEIVQLIELEAAKREQELPRHLIIELTTTRKSRGLLRKSITGIQRPPMSLPLLEKILHEVRDGGEVVVTFAGVGDPLLHEQFDEMIRLTVQSGVSGVHVRTELAVDDDALDRLVDSGVDVISVDLHADCQATYQRMMGGRFDTVLRRIQYLLDHRRHLAGPPGTAGFALPWVVPRLQRRGATYDDIDGFFDRWQRITGTAVLEPLSTDASNGPAAPGDPKLLETVTPLRHRLRELLQRMTIFSDGNVPISELDLAASSVVGRAGDVPLKVLWPRLVSLRRALQQSLPPDARELQIYQP